ncbi:40S ribosomal protein S7 [Moesziomyces antarcticus T-34]|uniref:40S ribosomal protein S7 n=1 Tax=Pseudozyma antarctica (strain T-34) TaxID=1151754 RepID=M9M6R3_PSEA3|nr:40S ribosomal protein S7 [Moesziomyces antarcticus T-34]
MPIATPTFPTPFPSTHTIPSSPRSTNMTSAAVLRMNNDSPSRFSMSGSRRSILAGINTTTNALSSPSSANNADNDRDPQDPSPIPLSHTDALLRSRGNAASDAASLKHSPSVASRKSRSGSIASRKNPQTPASPTRSPSVNGNAAHDGYLAPSSASVGRSRGFSAASLGLRKSSSNLSQSDARSIDSRRGSSGNSFVNLIRNRSRNSSQTNLTTPEPVDPDLSSSGSRIRRFSSASRKMSIKMPALATRRSSASIRDGLYDEPEQLSPVPPVPSLPAAYPTNGAVDGYKALGASPAPLNTTSGSIRSRKFSRSVSQVEGTPKNESPAPATDADPFAKADGVIARARSKRASSASAAPARARGASEPPLGTTATDDTAARKGFLSSTTTKASGAAAGAAGAAGSLFGLARRKSSRSLKSADAEQDAPRQNGMAAAAADSDDAAQSDSASDESEDEQAVRDKAARVAKLTANDVKITPQQLRDDIEVARHALNLFLNSRMIEAERIIEEYADSRLYYALGYALIATIKGFMTFEPADLAIAISLCKDALTIANLLRKPSSAVSNFGRFVRGTGQSPSALAQMDEVQQHAELVYAEAVLLKAVLGIAYAGDFFAFVSEALNMRNAYGIYRSLQKYVDWSDEKGQNLDEDFKSGVYLGNGLISMILGLVPGKVLKIMEVFGYTGDTAWAMKTLSKAGQWSADPKQVKPGMPVKDEGVRRQICDMSMLAYHLVISTFIPVNGVDIDFADKVLHYNLRRYPEGVFFLYFSGRLYSTQALAEKAITQFETARDIQKEYVQLKHICIWDLSLCNMSLTKWKEAHDQFAILAAENNWSKAVYNYGRASNLYESAQGEDQRAMKEAADIFKNVPNLTQKIAGKSIPMEKFVARKSKKFTTYGRLLLPGLEFAYVYHCLSNAPRYILCDEALVMVSDALADLHDVEDPSQYYSGDEYYDDLCLAHFLRGVCLKFIACPEKHSKVRPKESPIPEREAAQQAEISFKTVLEHGHQLKLDHWLVYFAHYELGRLYAGTGRDAEAKEQLNLVLSQKTLEDRGRKGKYSLQNMVHLRANGALNAIDGSGK